MNLQAQPVHQRRRPKPKWPGCCVAGAVLLASIGLHVSTAFGQYSPITESVTAGSSYELSSDVEDALAQQGIPGWSEYRNDTPETVFTSQQTLPSVMTSHTGEPYVSALEAPVCLPFWEHRTAVIADFLYLNAREVDLPYATHVDGPINNAVPLAPSSVVDSEYSPGIRIGGTLARDSWSSFTAAFWHYRSDTGDDLVLPGGTGWIRPEVTHPDTSAADFDKLAATANYEIDFQMVDAAYTAILRHGTNYSLNYLVGLRYAHLDQDFHSEFTVLGSRTVDTQIDFNGLGVRAGLDGERLLGRGFSVYGGVFGSLLAGQFSTDYEQQFNLAGVEASAGFSDNRVVPQLEMEAGISWQDPCGKLRLRAGYYRGAWFNVATTPTFIDAVQTSGLPEVDESLLFDGMTIRVEYRL